MGKRDGRLDSARIVLNDSGVVGVGIGGVRLVGTTPLRGMIRDVSLGLLVNGEQTGLGTLLSTLKIPALAPASIAMLAIVNLPSIARA